MTDYTTLGEDLSRIVATMVERGVEYLPSIVGAVLLLIVGWLAALLLRSAARRLLLLLDVVVARMLGRSLAERVRFARSARVVGAIVFWVVLLVFITAATQVLGLQAFTQWLARVIDYLPELLAGLMIVVAGYIVSRIAADLILRTSGPLAPAQRLVAARAAQVTILAAAVLVGAEQIGIRVTLLAIFVGVAAVAIAGGVVVAISLGARVHVANLIGVQQTRQRYTLGQRIRVAGFDGRILEFAAHAVVLETEDGTVTLPGRVFNEQPVVLLAHGGADG
ncbi:MAG: hypothetical protein ABI920_08420 [Casimicrobiaceae bacterium]